ncbi:unnamed protein product [Rangifer tarandus platyrhynchus]|uniref:Uncharacterized protein n=2 Tax=Rangifer tarandus platyrhynchus TaxID=3082113 RepID=A0ABN8YMH9_RANTA|nr:unnamed protein product [Rangifer tarandus platyrhynchus]CAI9701329.1 unnamed protein product [Rangifer tarandus platyrhynchus]
MSRRTSTTRAYKSRRASPAAGGERARAQHSRQVSGTDRPMGDRWTMHGHGLEGKEETDRRQVRGAQRGGVGDRVEGTRVPSQLLELEPEAYAEPRAAPACARMETQPLRRSID